MDAEAFAEKLASGYASYPKCEPGVYGVFGLFGVYITVLTFAVFTDFPIERIERMMNGAVIAGFVVPYAYFWYLRRRHRKALNADYEKLWSTHYAASVAADDFLEMSKKVRSLYMGQWGTPYTIGFINE